MLLAVDSESRNRQFFIDPSLFIYSSSGNWQQTSRRPKKELFKVSSELQTSRSATEPTILSKSSYLDYVSYVKDIVVHNAVDKENDWDTKDIGELRNTFITVGHTYILIKRLTSCLVLKIRILASM
jgi:hypothetical protein